VGSGTTLKSFYSTPLSAFLLTEGAATPSSVPLSLASRDVAFSSYTENEEYTKINIQDEVFINWFVGFSGPAGESNFTIILHKDSNGIVKNVAFRFIIKNSNRARRGVIRNSYLTPSLLPLTSKRSYSTAAKDIADLNPN
jgi:hypothetical protein